MGVENILTFDAHDPRVQNAIPSSGFDNVQPTYQFIKALCRNIPDLQFDPDHFMVISPDEGAMGRAVYYGTKFLALMWVCSTRDVTTQQLSMAATRLLLMSIWVHPVVRQGCPDR